MIRSIVPRNTPQILRTLSTVMFAVGLLLNVNLNSASKELKPQPRRPTATTKRGAWPPAAAVDARGSIYFSDADGTVLRRIGLDGRVVTIAGAAGDARIRDGRGRAARLNMVVVVGVGKDGSVFLGDSTIGDDVLPLYWLRHVSPSGDVRTVGPLVPEIPPRPRQSSQDNPSGASSPAGPTVNDRTAPTSYVVPIPSTLLVLGSGELVVSDTGLHCLYKASRKPPFQWLAGSPFHSGYQDGKGDQARFMSPAGMAEGTEGAIYVADEGNNRIRRVTLDGEVTTFAGGLPGDECRSGRGTNACLVGPGEIVSMPAGDFLILAKDRRTICRLSSRAEVSLGTGGYWPEWLPGQADITKPVDYRLSCSEIRFFGALTDKSSLILDETSQVYHVRAQGRVHALGELVKKDSVADGWLQPRPFEYLTHLAWGQEGELVALEENDGATALHRILGSGAVETVAQRPCLIGDGVDDMSGITRGWAGEWVLLESEDLRKGGLRFLQIRPNDHTFSRLPVAVPPELESTVPVYQMNGSLIHDPVTDLIYGVSSPGGKLGTGAWVFTLNREGQLKLLAGNPAARLERLPPEELSKPQDGQGREARFDRPQAIAPHPEGGILLLEDLAGNLCIRRVTPAGEVITLIQRLSELGAGSGIEIGDVGSIAADRSGTVYLADSMEHCVLKITGGKLIVHAGRASESGWKDGTRLAARFDAPGQMISAPNGDLYLLDGHGSLVRRITPRGKVTTIAGVSGESSP